MFDPRELRQRKGPPVFTPEWWDISAPVLSVHPLSDEALELAADFRPFLRWAWPLVEAEPLVWESYVEGLAVHLQAVELGQIKRLWIHLRPRLGKTTIASVIYDAWLWARDPTRRVLSSSFSPDRVKSDCSRTRLLITHPEYVRMFGRRVKIRAGESQKHRFDLTAGGYRYTALYGSGAIGDGGDILRLDDAQNETDQKSVAGLVDDFGWYFGTWRGRGNKIGTTPEVCVMQRLGPFDLAGMVREAEPNHWDVLTLETVKTPMTLASYHKRHSDGSISSVALPKTDTALTRSGAWVDDRQPGELLSARIDEAAIKLSELVSPEKYHAQDLHNPLLVSLAGAKLHLYDRATHLRSFARRFGVDSIQTAVRVARSQGWTWFFGGDHGIGARREIGIIGAISHQSRELWAIGLYSNTKRTTTREDAIGIRREFDRLGIAPSEVTVAVADVGNSGKGDDVGRSINQELSAALGMTITTPQKTTMSIELGVELLNTGFAAQGGWTVYVDEGLSLLDTALGQWDGGEGHKDFVDALRYPACQILYGWQCSPVGVRRQYSA